MKTLLQQLQQYNALLDGKPHNLTFSREGVQYTLLPELLVQNRKVIQKALETVERMRVQPELFLK